MGEGFRCEGDAFAGRVVAYPRTEIIKGAAVIGGEVVEG